MKTINDLSNVLDSFDSWLSACAVVTAVRDLPTVNVRAGEKFLILGASIAKNKVQIRSTTDPSWCVWAPWRDANGSQCFQLARKDKG